MSSQEFEVGDRVRRISGRHCGMEIGDETFIKETNVDSYGQVKLEDYNGYHMPEKFELISKGSELDMQDVDAIAVEGEESLLEYVYDMAENKEGLNIQDFDNLIYPDRSEGMIVEQAEIKELDLPEDWNELKKFLEQESQPTPTLNGREAEINGTQVKIGCWEGTSSELKALKGHMEGVGITSGAVAVKGERVDVEELYQFIEDVKEVVEN